jgi:DNA-directed RNA polymerase subunit N (RpoN/RPB10)
LLTGTYVACLDCGKEFAYDWNEMKRLTPRADEPSRMPALAPKQAA